MIIPTRLSILSKFRDNNHLPTTLRKHCKADLRNRQDLFCATQHWYRVQWGPDRAFINLYRLKGRKFTVSLSMQLPLSPLFPLVSSTDSKQSIRTSPGLIFICLKKGKTIWFIFQKQGHFYFPALLSCFLLSTSYSENPTHAYIHTNQLYIPEIITTSHRWKILICLLLNYNSK